MATLCRVHGFRCRIGWSPIIGLVALLAGCAAPTPGPAPEAAAAAGGSVILAVRDIPATDLTDPAGARILSTLAVPASPGAGRRVELVVRTPEGRIRSLVVPASATLRPGALLPIDE